MNTGKDHKVEHGMSWKDQILKLQKQMSNKKCRPGIQQQLEENAFTP